MISVFKLSAMAVLPVVASVILYIFERKTAFGKLGKMKKQLFIGIVFGGIAILGTEFGVNVGGAVINVRDAAVLSAGLVFGAPAGIIAGFLGGIERFFAVYWGAGTYTQLACTVSTILAGLIGAALRKHMFDDKKPSWPYALGIGIVTEVLHMLMIFVTNMSDIKTAFTFVEKCSVPMISANGLSLMLSVLIVTLIGKERVKKEKGDKQLSVQFQRGLLICIAIAILITGTFTLFLQNSISKTETDNLLSLNIADVKSDIQDASDSNLLRVTSSVAARLNESENPTKKQLDAYLAEFNVSEINIIDADGKITQSTNDGFIGYDMSSGKQSEEFLVLLKGEEKYVQSYQPISYNKELSRKYAGAVLNNGGFVQVGYDAVQFQSDLSEIIGGITKNRHIGKDGCVLIADENLNVVSAREGQELSEVDLKELSSLSEDTRFTMTLYDASSYCMYEKIEGYYVLAVLPVAEAVFTRNISVYVMLFMEILIFVCLFILIYYLIKQLVVNNIRKVNESLSMITNGNLDVTVDVRANEEFASLSDDINSTVVTMKKYIAEAAARIDKELEFAKSIQHSALPSVFPPFPNRTDFSIFATMDAAKEVGGDFYDFYFTGNNEFAFLVADVSGKGIPAAMFMMRAKTLIKSYAEAGMSVEKILTRANEKLCEGNDAEMFVTAWIGKINLETGALSFANAGHNPPLVKRGNGEYEYLKSRAGFVLGGMEGIVYKLNELQLSPGDNLFLYTDGVTEATDANEELYGDKRLSDALNSAVTAEPDAICRLVKEDVDRFVGEAPQFDDITMLGFRWKGENGSD